MSSVKLISATPNGEALMAYCARVSSSHQDNPEYAKLLKYCLTHGHVSVFEQASMTCEVVTSRAISAQILRHKSFSFQEFSQRYSPVASDSMLYTTGRKQAEKNRQSSVEPLEPAIQNEWLDLQREVDKVTTAAYNKALALGVAREQARMVLPLATSTRLYICGSVRSWVHYLQVRCTPETQAEHRQISDACKAIFIQQFPETSKALGWL